MQAVRLDMLGGLQPFGSGRPQGTWGRVQAGAKAAALAEQTRAVPVVGDGGGFS